MLLLERNHISFEQWFINQVMTGTLPEEKSFTVASLRQDYLNLCWTEEELWQKWSDNAQETT